MTAAEQLPSAAPSLPVSLHVNGHEHRLELGGHETLLQVLRAELHLTGPKFGCGIGYCGACTVRVDGQVAHSCCLLAGTLAGRTVTTIEGIGNPGNLDDVQSAMLSEGALQCGYCTPGIVTTIRGLLDVDPDPDEHTIREWLGGNICRCTGFESIVRAALTAARNSNARRASDGVSEHD